MCIWFEINSIYCQRNFEVMLIESFSTIQCQIELVNNSKTEMEMSAPLLQQVFQSIHFSRSEQEGNLLVRCFLWLFAALEAI